MEKGAVSGQIDGKLNHLQKEMAPRAGFEPATCRLTVECSTAELPGNRAPRRAVERGNTNALTVCQALFRKKIMPLVSRPILHHFSACVVEMSVENSENKPRQKRFGVDPASGRLSLGNWHLPLPRSRIGRLLVGGSLILGGTLGFLPVLGFWMVPLGLLVLSHDLPYVRRKRRRFAVWWERRRLRRRD